MKSRETHRVGENGRRGQVRVAEIADQVTELLRSLANLPSLLSLDKESHRLSPIDMKHVPP